jgi:hypothetical protein
MTGNKSVRVAFGGLREAGNSAKLTQMIKSRLATGQQLMNIRLVTNIKYQTVFLRIENSNSALKFS